LSTFLKIGILKIELNNALHNVEKNPKVSLCKSMIILKKKLKFPISYNQIMSTDKMGVSFFGLLIISPFAPRKKNLMKMVNVQIIH
jgi:hypothetical protein